MSSGPARRWPGSSALVGSTPGWKTIACGVAGVGILRSAKFGVAIRSGTTLTAAATGAAAMAAPVSEPLSWDSVLAAAGPPCRSSPTGLTSGTLTTFVAVVASLPA